MQIYHYSLIFVTNFRQNFSEIVMEYERSDVYPVEHRKMETSRKIVEQADSLSPDELADAYMELTADLAFAQTHFPASRITIYLNNLASALRQPHL